jgi:hypothetical protein
VIGSLIRVAVSSGSVARAGTALLRKQRIRAVTMNSTVVIFMLWMGKEANVGKEKKLDSRAVLF